MNPGFLPMYFDIETVISDTIRGKHPNSWHEDHISYSLIENLVTNLNGRSFDFGGRQKYIRMVPLKVNGMVETRFGDIAIITHIEYTNAPSITGVAFIEAKRRYTNAFDAIKFDQLQRILGNAPYAQLWLYDFQASRSIFPAPFWPPFFHDMTYGFNIPLNTATDLNTRSRDTLLRHSYPITHQIIGRFLHGHDLHIAPEAVQIVSGEIPDLGRPPIVLLLSLTYNEAPSTDIFPLDLDKFGKF